MWRHPPAKSSCRNRLPGTSRFRRAVEDMIPGCACRSGAHESLRQSAERSCESLDPRAFGLPVWLRSTPSSLARYAENSQRAHPGSPIAPRKHLRGLGTTTGTTRSSQCTKLNFGLTRRIRNDAVLLEETLKAFVLCSQSATFLKHLVDVDAVSWIAVHQTIIHQNRWPCASSSPRE